MITWLVLGTVACVCFGTVADFFDEVLRRWTR